MEQRKLEDILEDILTSFTPMVDAMEGLTESMERLLESVEKLRNEQRSQ